MFEGAGKEPRGQAQTDKKKEIFAEKFYVSGGSPPETDAGNDEVRTSANAADRHRTSSSTAGEVQ